MLPLLLLKVMQENTEAGGTAAHAGVVKTFAFPTDPWGSFLADCSQPSQHRNTGSPLIIIFMGTPIDPSRFSVWTAHAPWAMAKRRSVASEILAILACTSESSSFGVDGRTLDAAPLELPPK